MFDKVCIIGFGLIGSSIARNLKNKKLARSVACLDRSQDVCDTADRLELADQASVTPQQVVTGAELVILCVPVGAMAATMKNIAPYLREGVIVTDVGSVKQAVIDQVTPLLPGHCHFVPAHPIAGTEYSGPEAGFEELFEGRWCILTPDAQTPALALDKVYALWQAFGAKVEIMSAAHHDTALAMTSHLPHLIAFSIVGSASRLEDELADNIVKFSAGGFRGLTRTALSDPVMWRDIFLANDRAVLDVLDRFMNDISILRRHITEKDGPAIQDIFQDSRTKRLTLVE